MGSEQWARSGMCPFLSQVVSLVTVACSLDFPESTPIFDEETETMLSPVAWLCQLNTCLHTELLVPST